MPQREVRDNDLLDLLDQKARLRREFSVWRVVRDGRLPDQCGRPGGRWDDGSFDVLYTAETADGAIAEIWFHLAKGQPVFPTKVPYRLFELTVRLESCMLFSNIAELAQLGVDISNFGQLSHADRVLEYPRLQEVAEHASFLGADGLSVPSARWANANVVVFCEQIAPGGLSIAKDHGLVDWDAWSSQKGKLVGKR
ncbi:MAG: RES family NAD+ phosphorylase [Devosia sp.]